MAMTKKDYELIASALRAQKEAIATRSNIQSRIVDETAETMAAHFALLNDKFNKDTFLKAVGCATGGNNE